MSIIVNIIVAAIAIAIGAYVALQVSKRNANSAANEILKGAELEGNMLRDKALIKGKEEAMEIRSKAEKEANQRMQRIQSNEAKLKQRELQLNQQQGELKRKLNEVEQQRASVEGQRTRLDNLSATLDQRQQDIEKQERSVRDTLEHVSGLSADEAKEKLIESLQDEARTAAASYINDIKIGRAHV